MKRRKGAAPTPVVAEARLSKPTPAAPEPAPSEAVADVATGRPAWWTSPILWAGLVGLALFLPTVRYGFVWDDHRLIEINPTIRRVAGLFKLLTSDFWLTTGPDASGFWRPVIVFSYWLDGILSGWKPWAFRLMNALVHGGASALVAALALQQGLPRWAALLGALWFAAMPAHLESVAWISGRTDVYCAFFFLLALWLDRRARQRGRRWPGAPALTVAALALMSKEAAAPLIGVVGLAEWIGTRDARGRWDWRASARWLAPYLAVTAVYAVAHTLAVTNPPPPPYLSPEIRRRGLWGVWLMFPGYLKFLWPYFPHSPATVLPLPASPWAAPVLVGAAIQIAFVAGLVVLARRRSAASLPLGMFWMILLPPSIGMVTNAWLLFSERFIYTPSAGAGWGLAAGLAALRSRPRLAWAGGALAAVLVGSSAVETLKTLPTWESDETQFHAMTVRQPRNFSGQISWARWLATRGRDEESRRAIDAAAALDSIRPEIYSIRALLDFHVGRFGEAVENTNRAIAYDSVLLEPRLIRATALLHLGYLRDAEGTLRWLMAQTPENPPVWSLWGQYLVMRGHPVEGLAFLDSAEVWQHDDVDLEYARGFANARLGRADPARRAFQRATEIDSTYYAAWIQLAVACQVLGDVSARDRALARAEALPEGASGEVAEWRRRFAATAPPPRLP